MIFGGFLVLDKTRKERNPGAPGLAAQLSPSAPGLFLPPYSAELDLIERPWKVTKRRALHGRYHPTCRDFQAAIPEVLDALPTTYFQQPVSLMTRIQQQFDDVSLMAAQGIERMESPTVWHPGNVGWPLTSRHSPLFRATIPSHVAVSKHTHAARGLLAWATGAVRFSHRIVNDRPHGPVILSLLQDRPNLESVSVTWSLLDGTGATATGSFC